jgi:hypothetical protein
MASNVFKRLDREQTRAFQKWARDNYQIFTEISGLWHPVVQRECVKMNCEAGFRPES